METTSPQNELLKEKSLVWQSLKNEIQKVVIGQSAIIDRILIALLCDGHVLLEGVPGLAKTTLIKAIASSIGLAFNRIQFTPDLLPADLIGTLIYNPKNHEFQTKKGPIFTNLLLADEINRAPAKVQSALLEAMQEHQVTIGETSYSLGEHFFVLATQNPIDQEGTYRLPEAQVDRFMFKLLVGYPTIKEEREIIERSMQEHKTYPIIDKEEISEAKQLVKTIYMDNKVIDYILNIVFASRTPQDFNLRELKPFIEYGASPRATLAINQAARAHAFLRKRHFVIPDDVKAVVPGILRHRILLTYEAEAESITSDQVIEKILHELPSP